MAIAMQIHEKDNVVIVLENVQAGDAVDIHEKQDSFVAREEITKGKKMAIAPIKKGEQVIKYGIPIGPMMSDAVPGDLICMHNLANVPDEIGKEARRRLREDRRKIMVYPRADGRFGIRNIVMVIPTSPDCNAVAEAISDATGCTWMCCNRTKLLENGRVSEYTKMALGYTGCNPNIHSVLVLKADGEKRVAQFVYDLVNKTGKPVHYLDITAAGEAAVHEGTAVVEGYMAAAAAQERELRPIDGLTLAIQNSASDWTTAVFGNPVVGKAMELLTKDGGTTIHGAVEGLLCGLEDILPSKFNRYEDVLKMLDLTEHLRELTLKETGLPLVKIEPSWVNIPEGQTTTIEKGYQILRYYDNTTIQGILDYCEQPPHNGAWISTFDNVLPPTTPLHASLQGAHMFIFTTSTGTLYYEIPHMVGIRSTGNEDTFNVPEFRKDFNAGAAFRDGIQKTGENLYQLILDAAEGKVITHTEKDKQKVFHMWYYTAVTSYTEIVHSAILPFANAADKGKHSTGRPSTRLSDSYAEAIKMFTELVK